MPIKTYECLKCGHEFEELILKEEHDEEVECPECGAPREYCEIAWSLLRPAPASYKGKGFYTTDYNKGKRAGDK